MKNLFILFALIISISAYSQNKRDYLKENRFDVLDSNFQFPQTDFNIIGFGA